MLSDLLGCLKSDIFRADESQATSNNLSLPRHKAFLGSENAKRFHSLTETITKSHKTKCIKYMQQNCRTSSMYVRGLESCLNL